MSVHLGVQRPDLPAEDGLARLLKADSTDLIVAQVRKHLVATDVVTRNRRHVAEEMGQDFSGRVVAFGFSSDRDTRQHDRMRRDLRHVLPRVKPHELVRAFSAPRNRPEDLEFGVSRGGRPQDVLQPQHHRAAALLSTRGNDVKVVVPAVTGQQHAMPIKYPSPLRDQQLELDAVLIGPHGVLFML